MKQSEKSKKAILTHSSGPRKNLKQLFCDNSKSKIVASVYCAYASKDKIIHMWPKLKKKKNFIPKVPLAVETS
jgi:hypothetical protein